MRSRTTAIGVALALGLTLAVASFVGCRKMGDAEPESATASKSAEAPSPATLEPQAKEPEEGEYWDEEEEEVVGEAKAAGNKDTAFETVARRKVGLVEPRPSPRLPGSPSAEPASPPRVAKITPEKPAELSSRMRMEDARDQTTLLQVLSSPGTGEGTVARVLDGFQAGEGGKTGLSAGQAAGLFGAAETAAEDTERSRQQFAARGGDVDGEDEDDVRIENRGDKWDDRLSSADEERNEKRHRGDDGRFAADVSGKKGTKQRPGKEKEKRERKLDLPDRDEKPASFLPRMFYFENTYLGGNAAYLEQLRRLDAALSGGGRPYRLAQLPPQAFDPPDEDGMALTATLDRRSFETEGRVILQVGLQGSERYGWRRPPLDIVLVIDAPALAAGTDDVTTFVIELLRQIGPQDRLGVLVAGADEPVLASLGRKRSLRTLLPPKLDALRAPTQAADGVLGATMTRAGTILQAAAADSSSLPGTQTIFVLTRAPTAARATAATTAAHALTVQGVVTSVVELDAAPYGGDAAGLWRIANAGHGNYHRVAPGDSPAEAVRAELETLSRVVARLLRLNVRLGKGVQAIRVLGSRVLDEEEARQVKAREVATDRQLSKSMGIESDRGEDDDGIQTVIPYFYGGDAHVVLIELWVEEPGEVADVTLKYKDMVNLRNAAAHTAVALRTSPRPDTPAQLAIARNVQGFQLGAALERAGHRVRHGDMANARQQLAIAARHAEDTTATDRALVQRLDDLVRSPGCFSSRDTCAEALVLAGRRRVGESGQ